MTRPRIARRLMAAIIVLAFAGLAVAAPTLNKKGGPPRAVFLTLPPDLPVPEVSFSIDPHGAQGWRIEIAARAFVFTDLCVGTAEARPIGHAHVIVGGVKVASAYGPIVDLGPLPPGSHEVTVVLRGQDHRALIGGGKLLKAESLLRVPDPTAPASARQASPDAMRHAQG